MTCVVIVDDQAINLKIVSRFARSLATDVDVRTFEEPARALDFVLHPGLKPEMLTPGVRLTAIERATETGKSVAASAAETPAPEPVRYRVELPAGQRWTAASVMRPGRVCLVHLPEE